MSSSNAQWKGSIVQCKYMDCGQWEVIEKDKKGWCELKALNDTARAYGKNLWIRTRDLVQS